METFAPPNIELHRREDGSLLLRSRDLLAEPRGGLLDWLRSGAASHPDRLLLAERGADGWRRLTWGGALAATNAAAAGLRQRGLTARPLLVLSGNGIEHLVLTHIVPWADPPALYEEARSVFSGKVTLAQPGLVFDL